MIVCPGGGGVSFVDMGSTTGTMTREHFIVLVLGLIDNYGGGKVNHLFLTHPDADHMNYALWQHHGGVILELLKRFSLQGYPTSKIQIHLGNKQAWTESKPDFLSFFSKTHANGIHQMDPSQAFHIIHHENEDAYGTIGDQVDLCPGLATPVIMNILKGDIGEKLPIKRVNERSLVMKLTYSQSSTHGDPQTSMMFFGDIEDTNVINKMLHNHKKAFEADVMVAPHHGSDTNGNGQTNIYNAVNPQHVIISSHIDGPFGHPGLETINSICTISQTCMPCPHTICVNSATQAHHHTKGWKWRSFHMVFYHTCTRTIYQTTLWDGSKTQSYTIVTNLVNDHINVNVGQYNAILDGKDHISTF